MKAVSFYMSNIPKEVVQAQKAVFDHFEIEIEQVETTLTHGQAIDKWLSENDWKAIAIFDIDCIPLNKNIINNLWRLTLYGVSVYGAAQKANHIANSEIYCSPAFCCFTRELWERTNRATFVDIPGYDVGGFFSAEAKKVGELELLYPTKVEQPMWDLNNFMKFGLGTTYGNTVYHAFQSRMNSGTMFIKKCNQVING